MQPIQNLVNKAMHDTQTPWWIDTVCIPPRQEDYELRNSAIRNMRRIYKSATKVLVLDAELMMMSKTMNPIEIYLRLKMTSWIRRLWALQEALMAENLTIQFADGTLSMSDLAAAVQAEGDRLSRSLYTRYNFLARTTFGALVNKSTATGPPILEGILKLLQWRATSRACDKTVCLANMMHFDPGPIIDIPEDDPEARMVKLLRILGHYPLIIIFQPPRLQRRWFRWGPTSFINTFRKSPTNLFRVIRGNASIGPDGDGLLLCRPGFHLQAPGTFWLFR